MRSKKDWKESIGLALLIIAAVTVVILCFYGARQTAPPEGGAPAAAAEPVQTAGDEAAAPADKVAAVILHTNDVHCGFEENIGYDGLALYKKEMAEKYGSVILVDAGDFIQDEYRSPQGRITIIGVTPQAPDDFVSS